ncbi:hypothetical protein [Acinetobacter sp. Marseille-Q1618]|uniref:hypothetical protein n=1 Tax=Acinetobacter sp. Marseille-Q1618 TaxID=2697502 RepID=UPI00156D5BC1|nr:hypothetical protein [Acinetobacter sp. Marseille-Q1618]
MVNNERNSKAPLPNLLLQGEGTSLCIKWKENPQRKIPLLVGGSIKEQNENRSKLLEFDKSIYHNNFTSIENLV